MPCTLFIPIEAPGTKAKFCGGAAFQKSKDQYIIGVGHEEDINYETMSQGP